jgi:nucleoside-diphosphate-sugar epimerase
MKKIFLTGGSGFIGRSILEKLSKKYEIYAPTRQELNLVEFNKIFEQNNLVLIDLKSILLIFSS